MASPHCIAIGRNITLAAISAYTPNSWCLQIRQYQLFRWAFLAYLLMPTALLVIKATLLSWEHKWVNVSLEQVMSLIIFCRVVVAFVPAPAIFYNRAFSIDPRAD